MLRCAVTWETQVTANQPIVDYATERAAEARKAKLERAGTSHVVVFRWDVPDGPV